MFKAIALAAVASAAPVYRNNNITDNAINNAANTANHAAERAARIEMAATKEAFKVVSKYGKLAVLQGQYADYRFAKHLFWRLKEELHYRGPAHGCKAAVFARCVATASANRTVLDEDEFSFEKAIRYYPQCTAKSGCATAFSKLAPAQKTALRAKARKSDRFLEGLVRNATRTQDRLRMRLERDMRNLTHKYQRKHQANAMQAANKILDTFKCDKQCFINKAQMTNNLEMAWNTCKCQSPVDIKFSPEEVLEMMSQHNMDTTAGIDEEEVEFAAEPTSEAGSSWGWVAFGALATANAAYIATSKKN